MKTEFIQKWSNWWMFDKNKEQLDIAFERELNEIIKNDLVKSKALEMLEMLVELFDLLEENQGEARFYTRGHYESLKQLIKEATEL
jgi:hypothetical protein